jgi:hypothetical protein
MSLPEQASTQPLKDQQMGSIGRKSMLIAQSQQFREGVKHPREIADRYPRLPQ